MCMYYIHMHTYIYIYIRIRIRRDIYIYIYIYRQLEVRASGFLRWRRPGASTYKCSFSVWECVHTHTYYRILPSWLTEQPGF